MGKTAVEFVHSFCGRYIVMKLEDENGGKEAGASFGVLHMIGKYR